MVSTARALTRRRKPPENEPEDFDDFRDLEEALRIDENALEVALRDQPTQFYRVSSAYAIAISRRDAAKQALQDAEAGADLAVRREAQEEDRKITEGEVKATAQTSAGVLSARDRLNALAEQVGRLGALKEAFQQRSYALKDLAGLYVANYYTASEDNAMTRAVRDRDASAARRAMNAERRRP
jgi:hypothetical protein